MPLYEYECDVCGKRFERIQKFSDPLVEVCPNCGKGPVRKLLSSPAIQFKGSGWYVTDYAKKSSTDAGTTKPSESSGSTEKKASDSSATPAASTSKPAESSTKKD
jgi:putative FmdB family regulatory protein